MDQVIKLIIDASGKNLQIKEFLQIMNMEIGMKIFQEEFQMYLKQKKY